jgi:hypothetical protein
MRIRDGIIQLSAADLVGHLSCRHLTQLDAAVARGAIEAPKDWDPLLQILRERGLAHEDGYVQHLEQAGLEVVRIDGAGIEHEAIAPPWGAKRGCVHIDGGVRIARREELGDDPPGDLLQAGPLLVSGGRSLVDGEDREGFSAAAEQFDSDITIERHPRCALGLSATELLAVCCDGRRSGVDGGLGLGELARLLISFGAEEAINLDGGGSATLVHRKHLLNRPYSHQDQPAPESRPVVTALLFEPS